MSQTNSVSPTSTLPGTDPGGAGVPQRLFDAWARNDAGAYAEVFTEDGSMVKPGRYLRGRDEIRSFMASAFAGPYKGTRITGTLVDVRYFSKDAAVLIIEGGLLGPAETKVAVEHAIRATWVVVRQNGQWKLAAYHNSPVSADT
jgi:uncharacterized protein (TIGR02246 family)